MIIVLKPRTTEENLNRVIKMVETKGLEAHVVRGEEMTIIGCIGDTTQVDPKLFEVDSASTRSCTFKNHINLPTAPFIQRILSLMSRE